LKLPALVKGKQLAEVSRDLADKMNLDPGSLSAIQDEDATPALRKIYEDAVHSCVDSLKNVVILTNDAYRDEMASLTRRVIKLPGNVSLAKAEAYPLLADDDQSRERHQDLLARLRNATRQFGSPAVAAKMLVYVTNTLAVTHALDEEATAKAQNNAAAEVPAFKGEKHFAARQVLVPKGQITEDDWNLLREEKQSFLRSLGWRERESRLGLAGMAMVITGMLGAYIWMYHRRIVSNHARGLGVAALLLMMLLLAQLAAVGSGPLYVFGVAPTLLVAMIMCIAYDRRVAMGVASMHGLLTAAAVAPEQGIGFFLIIWVGVVTTCFMMNDVRTRSKLIEVGVAAGVAMMFASMAAGAVACDPLSLIAWNCLYTGLAGVGVGFLVLGILPFIEKLFKITTSMTLLEVADASHPLLKRLALDSAGTYNHSLQVATLAEAAADAIGANSLLCRVASYYHDIGKINKSDYFVENQHEGANRHLNLSPSVSLLIIIGHVKDGCALAREYNLPSVLIPFIQQHHGTTLVEYFYNQARNRKDLEQPDMPAISETQFRYPGPKPRSREVAVVMLADVVESAARCMPEPTPGQIEGMVHDQTMKRLIDGQFEECDLTTRDMERIERTLVKTLAGIHHSRIAYPAQNTGVEKYATPTPVSVAAPSVKSVG